MDRGNDRTAEAGSFDRQPELGLQADAVATAAASSCGIAVMAKASTPGRAKTRLVPPLTLRGSRRTQYRIPAGRDRQHRCSPPALRRRARRHRRLCRLWSAGFGGIFPPYTSRHRFGLIAAWLPNFGDCLLHAIGQILARGHAGAVVLNADSPTLPTALLNETAEMLARPGDRAVLGPSSDGGYYLLGLKAAHRRMFEDIAWSTERVAEQTRERAREIGLRAARAARMVRCGRHAKACAGCMPSFTAPNR